ncbi:MAG TPA: hypothetical protein VGU63_05050 [Candidatus Acidoferrales bacterium]|nr:hypothetical protein [Candidatus Acidoferrales bacterium]
MSGNSSNISLWGKAWSLDVKTVTSDPNAANTKIISQSGWDPEALRVTFEVVQSTLPSPFWFADIKVYNLGSEEIQNLLWNATWLTLKAGFQSGTNQYSIIWDGPILQVLFNRENVTDLVIEFNCLAGPWLLEQQFISISQGNNSSQYNAVSKMISQMHGNVAEQVSPKAKSMLQAKQYPRGKTIFGSVSKYISEISDDNFLNNWIDGNQHYLSELYNPDVTVDPDIVYGPPLPPGSSTIQSSSGSITRSILGVPIQNPFGAIFTVLLDPRLKVQIPPLLVKLDQTVIQQQKLQYPNVMTPLDQSGLFVVGQVKHYGDTRGNDWATEVTGFTRGYAQGLLNGTYAASERGF